VVPSLAALPASAATREYARLAEAYDNAGITDDSDSGAGDLDGSGHTLSAQALDAAGWRRAAPVRVNGMTFTWPDTRPGAPDNAVSAGQRIRLGGSGTALGLLVAATDGAAEGTGTITYADGSTQPYELSFADWFSGGRGVALTLPYRNGPAGPQPGSHAKLSVREVGLAPGKKLRSVTLPRLRATGEGSPRLHVFALATRPVAKPWVGTWASAIQGVYDYPSASEWSIRMPVHTSVGGTSVRIRLSNAFATRPLRIGHATVARRAGGAAVHERSLRGLTFGGRPNVTIPAGAEAVSDPVPLRVPARSDLVVSLYLPGQSTHVTYHWLALQTVYISKSGAGDHTADSSGTAYPYTSTSWSYLSGVDVVPDRPTTGAVVALGDSITDGADSTQDANRRWPDYLARRLAHRTPTFGVLNAGINANRIVGPGPGENPPALDRLDRDVLAQPGVRTLILFEGVNDVSTATSDQVIAGMKEIAARAHAQHLRVIGATVIPFKDRDTGGNWTPEKEAWRQRVNAFVRNSGGVFDGYADFAAAVEDPADPARYHPDYDSGDHLHPNEAGMRAFADSIDLDDLG
jgi:lysophospholipase L1-like esterase